jgi:hypothetical protein
MKSIFLKTISPFYIFILLITSSCVESAHFDDSNLFDPLNSGFVRTSDFTLKKLVFEDYSVKMRFDVSSLDFDSILVIKSNPSTNERFVLNKFLNTDFTIEKQTKSLFDNSYFIQNNLEYTITSYLTIDGFQDSLSKNNTLLIDFDPYDTNNELVNSIEFFSDSISNEMLSFRIYDYDNLIEKYGTNVYLINKRLNDSIHVQYFSKIFGYRYSIVDPKIKEYNPVDNYAISIDYLNDSTNTHQSLRSELALEKYIPVDLLVDSVSYKDSLIYLHTNSFQENIDTLTIKIFDTYNLIIDNTYFYQNPYVIEEIDVTATHFNIPIKNYFELMDNDYPFYSFGIMLSAKKNNTTSLASIYRTGYNVTVDKTDNKTIYFRY